MISLRTIEGIDLKRIGESYLYDLLQKAENIFSINPLLKLKIS